MDNGEVLAFVLYFILMLGIGVVFFFKERGAGEKEYFLGGRSMGAVGHGDERAGVRHVAWLLMGLPGSILAFGFGQIWIGIGLAIGTALNWILVARRLRCFSEAAKDSITLPQYLSNRFATKSPCLADHLRGHLPRVLHDLCGVSVRLRRDGVHDGLPQPFESDGNADLRGDHDPLHVPWRLQGRVLDGLFPRPADAGGRAGDPHYDRGDGAAGHRPALEGHRRQ